MSPRSQEYLQGAIRRLDAARAALEADAWDGVVSLTYYAMLYAARAALSEQDQHARTHRGVWHLFRQILVEDHGFDAGLASAAAARQREREEVDYEAIAATREQARDAMALAERFVGAVAEQSA